MKSRNIFNGLSIVMTLFTIGLLASSASAAANRTWVAPSGDDNNPCTNGNPCKTFTGALAKTSAEGEIVVKESGNFGAVTIDKSITIDAGGKYAGIQAGSASIAIWIQAGNTDVIVLRGLTLKGFGGNSQGIGIPTTFAGVIHVEHCAISGFDSGIVGGTGTLFVQDSIISDCGQFAIAMDSGGPALVERTRLENNGIGLSVNAHVTVRSTTASGNRNSGFVIVGGTLNLENCVGSNNGTAVLAEPFPNLSATVVISNSVVTNNQIGLSQVGTGVIYSRGNNTVFGNNTDISGTLTPLGGS